MTAANKTTAPAATAPSQKTIADAKARLEAATLETIAIEAGNASATLKRLAGTADAIKGSVTTAVLRVVCKAAIEAVCGPLKATIEASGGRVSNLSTIRGAVVKMHAAYGAAETLPYWGSVAEAKASGDAALSALAESVIVDGVLSAERNVDAVTKLATACTAHGVNAQTATKWTDELNALIQQASERHEPAPEGSNEGADEGSDEDKAIMADEAAQLKAEIETLREIAEQAARIFGTQDRAALAILMMDVPEIELTAAE
ncbi:hypothetical protein J7E62_31075 [Variovorax paradoxus]|nr:hypothetical protein [Variovorax paradoxus]